MTEQITDDMVERGEYAIACLLQMLGVSDEQPSDGYRNEPPARTISRAVLRAALAECVVARQPDRFPDPPGGWRVPTWEYDVWAVQAWDDDKYPITLTSEGKGYGMTEDTAEAIGVRLLAAVQYRRQVAAEQAADSEVGDQHDG